MIEFDVTTTFQDPLLNEIEPIPKCVNISGYLYIVTCSVFPEYFKMGRTTDLLKRLNAYNSDAPYPTYKMTHCSDIFKDVVYAEKRIIQNLQEQAYTAVGGSREWFKQNALSSCIGLIEHAERVFI